MNREQLIQWIRTHYNTDAEYLWQNHPNDAVFRHPAHKKWFAILMDVPACALGLPGEETIEILDVKCDPILIGSLRQEPGFYPAYHMNKTHWITLALDGSVEDEKIQWLLDISYDLTNAKKKPRRKSETK